MIKTIINFLKAIAHVEKIYDLCTEKIITNYGLDRYKQNAGTAEAVS